MKAVEMRALAVLTALAAFSTALFAGCEFSPPSGVYECVLGDEGACPRDFICVDGLCVKPETHGSDGGDDAGDDGGDDCPLLPAPENGSVSIDDDVATYACSQPLYKLEGEETRTCVEGEGWSDSAPSCEAYCPPLSAPENGSVTFAGPGEPGVSIADHSCQAFYHFAGNEGARTRSCEEAGWSGSAVTCEPTGGYAVWPLASQYDIRPETVIDIQKGLEWQRNLSGSTYTWEQAKTYCDDLVYDGRSDWRLPTRVELQSLVDYNKATAPTIDLTAFPDTPSSSFWSASPSALSSEYAWFVSFYNGNADVDDVFVARRARCVR
jgi:hypothetical protein